MKKLSSLELEDINQIKQLLHRNFKPKTIGGWELVNELVLPCLNVERNEEVYEDSKIAGDFKAYKQASVSIFAIIYVREKMIIGLASVEGQAVEEKVPTVILARNGWHTRQQAAVLAEKTCLRTGPFKEVYDSLKLGKGIPEEKFFISSEFNLSGGRDAIPVPAQMFVLQESAKFIGQTYIQKWIKNILIKTN